MLTRASRINLHRRARAILAVLLFSGCACAAADALQNQVAGNASPYLAMHGDDPVRWQQWSAQTLERARRENKLLFVSVGFFSCYWCHVMQRESFRDAAVAKLLNENFIPVVVDRELDPALDARLLAFVETYRGSAGWPLNVFITPRGDPLLGGVYFPRQEFLTVLTRLAQSWASDHARLSELAQKAAGVPSEAVARPPKLIARESAVLWARDLKRQALDIADTVSGGFGEQSKFPMSAQLLALLAVYDAKQDKQLGTFLLLTLEQMAALGLRDHLSGGFFRYSTEPTWHTPHFEKMLYDNAQLATVYLRAAKIFRRADFERVARETLDFLVARMRAPRGGFYASLSAVDAQGVEGAYYQWSEAELERVLSADEFAVVRHAWQLESAAPFESGYLPLAPRAVEQTAAALRIAPSVASQLLERARMKVLAARERRSLPTDTKVIAAWNGLTLMAFSEAATLANGARYADAARDLRNYIVNELMRDDALWRVVSSSGQAVPGVLDDYAYIAAGLLRYAEFSQSDDDYARARRLMNAAWQRFYTDSGWVLSERSLLPREQGAAWLDDGALPAPSAVLMEVSFRLAQHYGDKALKQRALEALSRGAKLVDSQAFNYASHVPLAGFVSR